MPFVLHCLTFLLTPGAMLEAEQLHNDRHYGEITRSQRIQPQQIWAAGHYLLLTGVPLQTNARFKELFQAIYV